LSDDCKSIYRYNLHPLTLLDLQQLVEERKWALVFDALEKVGCTFKRDNDGGVCSEGVKWFHCSRCRHNLTVCGHYLMGVWLYCRRYVHLLAPSYHFTLTTDNIALNGILDFEDYTLGSMDATASVAALQPVLDLMQSLWCATGIAYYSQYYDENIIPSYFENLNIVDFNFETYNKLLHTKPIDNKCSDIHSYAEGFYVDKLPQLRDIVRSKPNSADFREAYRLIYCGVDVGVRKKLANEKRDLVIDTADPVDAKVFDIISRAQTVFVAYADRYRVCYMTFKKLWLVDEVCGFEVPRGLWDLPKRLGEMSETTRYTRILLTYLYNYRYDALNSISNYGFVWDDAEMQDIDGTRILCPGFLSLPIVGSIPVCTHFKCSHQCCKTVSVDKRLVYFYGLSFVMASAINEFSVHRHDDNVNLLWYGKYLLDTYHHQIHRHIMSIPIFQLLNISIV
jgi:hypothetical protein